MNSRSIIALAAAAIAALTLTGCVQSPPEPDASGPRRSAVAPGAAQVQVRDALAALHPGAAGAVARSSGRSTAPEKLIDWAHRPEAADPLTVDDPGPADPCRPQGGYIDTDPPGADEPSGDIPAPPAGCEQTTRSDPEPVAVTSSFEGMREMVVSVAAQEPCPDGSAAITDDRAFVHVTGSCARITITGDGVIVAADDVASLVVDGDMAMVLTQSLVTADVSDTASMTTVTWESGDATITDAGYLPSSGPVDAVTSDLGLGF